MIIIRANLIEDYDENDVRFPCGVCETHKKYLNLLQQNIDGTSTISKPISLEKLLSFINSNKK